MPPFSPLMAASKGVPAIKRLLLSLLVVGLVVCGAIYAIVTPPKPVIKPVASEPPSHTLAYQQQTSRPGGTPSAPAAETQSQRQPAPQQQQAMAPAAPAPAKQAGQPEQSAPQPKPQAAVPGSAYQQDGPPPDMAALPPDGEGAPLPDALPWQQRGERPYDPNYPEPGYPEDGADAPGPMGGLPGEEGYEQDGMEPMPGEEADPNAWPDAQGEQQEWVQVLVSGAGMHGMASDDAPMLFAFPYGRTLRVISRYGNWVEVTDPQSATTGWMKAQYLAPAATPGEPQEAETWYEDEEPRWKRRGWFRRNGGGLADMINRALGGH